jgi:hypothetical protein
MAVMGPYGHLEEGVAASAVAHSVKVPSTHEGVMVLVDVVVSIVEEVWD